MSLFTRSLILAGLLLAALASTASAADSVAVSIACPASGSEGTSSGCTVRVLDTAAIPSAPTGKVTLSSDRAGKFSPATCTLVKFGTTQSLCPFTYTPGAAGGTHVLKAVYAGDATHQGGTGSAQIVVTALVHATTTAINCSDTSGVTPTFFCFVQVKDTEATPTAPGGSVYFTNPFQGRFEPGLCPLIKINADTSFCEVSFRPGSQGPDVQPLSAHYTGDSTHQSSEATTQLRVNG